ncbi:IMPACT family protein [Ekhidna sp.]|uniref:IMPACT family protein n=1 Tax=Ekhidna sp. TaxID=2608089 RepID=UPI003B509ABF
MSSYYTIASPAEGFYKEKGSKFISRAYSVRSEEEIKIVQDDLRKEFHDARHHCFAWVLGLENQSWRANDDGEPAHSAGDPILGQIRSHGLTNILVVVIRYFGGTKLGVGGLIQAYKQATEDALHKVKKVEIFEWFTLKMNFSYDMMSQAERVINDFELNVQNRDFKLSCEIVCLIKKDQIASFQEKTKDLYNIAFKIEEQ